jgi:hypothetical protein
MTRGVDERQTLYESIQGCSGKAGHRAWVQRDGSSRSASDDDAESIGLVEALR